MIMNRRQVLKGLIATVSMLPFTGILRSTNALAATSVNLCANLPAVVRDQGMGATDAQGFVRSLPLSPPGTSPAGEAKQLWLNTTLGSGSYNGLSPYPGYQMNGTGANFQVGATGRGANNAAFGPKADFSDAVATITPSGQFDLNYGIGHQFFFAEGQAFLINYPNLSSWYRGYSAAYPVCMQSYDPTDPLNVTKHGRAGTGSQSPRPTFQLTSVQFSGFPTGYRGDARDYGNWAFRGMEWVSPDTVQSCSWACCQNNMLFENMVFNHVELILENANPNAGFTISNNNIVRFCAFFGQYIPDDGIRAQGIFASRTNLTLEDCVFWHCGWKIGLTRDATFDQGGGSIYNHCAYIDGGDNTAISATIRRNVFSDGSASGLSLRGSHVAHHNVIIDCPTPEFKSGGSGSDTENPLGVSQHSYCELIMGGANIGPGNPRGEGFLCADGTPDSFYAYSLAINNPAYGLVNNNWLIIQNTVPAQITHVGLHHNRAYAFAPPTPDTCRLVFFGSLASMQYVDDDNLTSPTSPMTNDQIYAAAGYASKQMMINAMIADPTKPWAYLILAIVGQAFNFNFNRTEPLTF